MKKRFVYLVVALCLAFSVGTFTACGDDNDGENGGKKDKVSFVTVSASTYETSDNAIAGYVDNEIGVSIVEQEGEDPEVFLSATLVSKESKGAVATDTLALTDAQKKDLASVEMFAVKAKVEEVTEDLYTEEQESTVQSATADMNMYVFNYGEGKFAYAVPVAKTGERISQSEAKSVYSYELLKNSTMVQMSEELGADGATWEFDRAEVMQYTANETYSVRYYDKARFEARTPVFTDNGDDNDYYSYYVTEGETTYTTNSYENAYTYSHTVAESTQNDFLENFVYMIAFYVGPQGLTKTATGYKADITYFDGVECEGSVTVTVTNGVLTQYVFEVTAEIPQGTETKKKGMRSKVEYTAIGSTTVSGADAAKAKVTAYKQQQAAA